MTALIVLRAMMMIRGTHAKSKRISGLDPNRRREFALWGTREKG